MFTFEERTAWDPIKDKPARGSKAYVYAYGDTAHASPLPITDDAGVPIESGQLDSGPWGVYPGFKQADHPICLLWDGVNEVTVWSIEGREGPPGPPGASDEVVAGHVTNEASATRGALNATFASKEGLAQEVQEVVKSSGYVSSGTGKNLYNVQADTVGGYYRQTDGAFVPYAGYRGSDFIPVTAGQPYTISHARFIVTYDLDGVFVTGVQQTQGVYTWTPAVDGLVRFSYAFTETEFGISPTVQMEEGTVATAPAPYKRVIDPVYELAGASYGVTARLNGNDLAIETTLGTEQLTINTLLSGGGNGVFNFDTTVLGTTNIHSTADDIAPIRTQMGTIGANHGFVYIAAWGPSDHDKTTADLGSVWTSGGREYVLLAINASGEAIFGPSYTNDGYVNVPDVNLTANLTHVSGATHTTELDYTLKIGLGAVQMYPAIGRRRQTVLLDGVTLAEGLTRGKELEVRESYEILDYKSIYDSAKANIGTSYAALDIYGAVRIENTYRFREGGVASADSAITEMQPTILGVCGFVQSVRLGGTVTRYLPGVKPIGGFDWSNGVDLDTYTVTQNVTTTDLHVPSVPPVMSLDVSGVAGFAMGYKPWESAATGNANRIAEAPTYLWNLRSTDKSYPTALLSEGAGWGRYVARAYRAYLTPAQAAEVAQAGTDALAAHAALETSTTIPK